MNDEYLEILKDYPDYPDLSSTELAEVMDLCIKLGKTSEREKIMNIVKEELQNGCKGTKANCYNIYQSIKKQLEKKA